MKTYAFKLPLGVSRTRVSFPILGEEVIAELYKPVAGTPNSTAPLPAVVFGGPLSSVKEQSTGAYGSVLASHGFACLSLDHRTYGESAGKPRQYENYENKIEDLNAAVEWLSEQEYIDSSRIGTCGVCLGAAYCASMAVQNDKVKAVGFVVGLFPRGGTPSQEGITARKLYEETGETRMIKAASITEDAAMPMQIAVDYYCDPERALVANYRNEVALMYREKWQEYDSMSVAPQLSLPACMIHGKQSFAVRSGMAFYDSIGTSSEKKSLHWIDTLPHTDFYDNPGAIKEIGGILSDHFHVYL